ncbi:MAG: 50S ribosomal protein L21 [Acidimicrobiales bacterium]
MYAVIRTGGKQYRVAQGQRIDVERLSADPDGTVSFGPLLVVDGTKVAATPGDLSSARVEAKVVGEARGPRITGFTYKSKANQRRKWGHRQDLTTIEITSISSGG